MPTLADQIAPKPQQPSGLGGWLASIGDEMAGAFARYGRRSGAQRDASLELLNQASAPGTDPIMGAGQKLLGLAGLITHPLAFFPTREEWDQRLQAAGNDGRMSRSIGGFLSDLPSLIDPQMAAGGAVLATAPLAAKMLNKADDVASLKAWRPPEIRDVTDKWDTDVYHATGNIFDEFRPSYRGSSFFGATPEAAKKGAQAGWGDGTGSGSLHTVHARIPSEEIRGLAFTPKERKWFDALPDVASEAEVDGLMKKAPSNNIPAWFTVFDEVQNADGTFSYVKKKDAWRKSYSEAKADGRNVYGELVPHWGPQSDESKSAKWALDDGMSGYLVQDEAGLTVAMSDPNRIWMRSHSGMLNKADDAADAGIIAYHGSPHSFDKFDMSKIGTGEGNQAYMRGLYFAEAEDTAKSYRDVLSSNRPITQDNLANLDFEEQFKIGDAIQQAGEKAGFNTNSPDAFSLVLNRLAGHNINTAHPVHDKARMALDEVVQHVPEDVKTLVAQKIKPPTGSMYQVKINATPEEFLNWDIPLSQQPKKVQEALRGLDPSLFAVDTWASKLDGAKTKGRTVSYGPDNRTGETAARAFEENLGGPEMAAEKLKAAGIKGVRYKDAGSRGGEGGTYNYVVFDDKLITILKKYGIPMTAGAGGAMMVAGQDMPPEFASQMGGT